MKGLEIRASSYKYYRNYRYLVASIALNIEIILMNLFTKTEFEQNPAKIHHKGRILTLGSCFAEHIGQKLVENKFKTLCNPFGIVYNPFSISSCIDRLHKNSLVTTKELQLCQDYYCHLDFHSQFNGIDKQATIDGINQEILLTHSFVNEGLDWLFLSLGTAFAYKHVLNNRFVNNCHKIPSKHFKRELLSSEEMVSQLSSAIEILRTQNPNLKVLLTVSPVRHIRDGLTANLRSKSRLIEVAHSLTEELENCFYFPSYEILVDELRDYRWYKEDLIHPSDQAVEYIWEHFKKFALDTDSIELVNNMKSILSNLNHKPFLAQSEQYRTFLKSTDLKIQSMEKDYPHLSFEKEKGRLEQQMKISNSF